MIGSPFLQVRDIDQYGSLPSNKQPKEVLKVSLSFNLGALPTFCAY